MRIDEFARAADGAIGLADRVRFSCFGFDEGATVTTTEYVTVESPSSLHIEVKN